MQQVFPSRSGAPTDDVILAPKSINPKADDSKDFDEFKLYGKQYIRYTMVSGININSGAASRGAQA